MILIFDYFETIMHNRSMDFNRALADLWKTYYKDKCCFNDITAYGEELFLHLQKLHKQGFEFAFVKDELPMYAQKFGGDVIQMSPSEEADFLMKCNEMEVMPCITEALAAFHKMDIPMYVLSNSGFSANALSIVLDRFKIGNFFKEVWSSADYGKIKPGRDFFEMAIKSVLSDNPTEKKENIVFIGDTYESDVKGATAAGIDVIWLNHKNENNSDNLPAHCIYHTSELEDMVKNLYQ